MGELWQGFQGSERNQRKEKVMKKLIPILFVVFAVAILAQAPADEVNPLELTELESAKLSLLLKDVQLSQLQIQIVQSQYQTAVAQRDARQSRLNALLDEFRELHSAPADKFSFDAVKMSFIPLPKETETNED